MDYHFHKRETEKLERTSCTGVCKSGVSHIFLSLVLALLCSGCVGKRLSDYNAGPTDTVPRMVLPLERPRSLIEEYVYPTHHTHQGFAWGPFGTQWKVLHARQPGSYAGFAFKGPCDFSEHFENVVLSFRMQPLRHDQHLRIALVSVIEDGRKFMVSLPLSEHRIREWGGWGLYAIRLSDFPSEGSPVDEESGQEETRRMSWSRVCELRLIAPSGRTWEEAVRLRNIQFGPARWDLSF